MRWHKNTILKGIHNPAFVDDTLDRFHKISTMENNPPEIRIENEIQVNFAVVQEVDDISLHQIESVRNSIECNLKEFETKLDDNNNDIGKKLGLLIAEVHKEEEDEENWEEVQEVENLDDVVNETYGFLIGMNEDETNSTDDKSQSSKEIIVEEGKSEEAKRKEEELEEKIEVEKIEPLPPKLSRKNSRLSEVYLESIKKENKTEDVSVIEKPKRNTKIEEKYLESVKLANENVPQIPKPPPLPNQLLFSPKINTEVKFLPKKNNRVSLKYLERINSPLIKTESKITNLQENKVIPEVKKPPKPPPLPNLIEPLIPGSLPDSNEPSLKPPSALLKQIEAPVQLRHVVPVKKAETPKISFKDRLSRILQDQISYYSHRDSSPTEMIQEENEENTENLEAYEIEKYKTIKTLSKAALKDKLEFVLTRGPPKRASFRNSFDVEIDIKRKNAVNALREIENLAVTTKEDEIETKIGEKVKEENTKVVNEDEDIVKKQKMLMGNVLKTIKLKNKVNNPFFVKDDEMKTELPT